jgi:transcriptional regulator with GAF, ATPase, and Fis domain
MELANKGTLFIDEIGETPKAIQVKLLRAIEDRSFVRVGGVVKRVVDFRLLAATNRDLVKEVEKGNFREDLYYRLCVVPFIVPPLRERGDDVILLAEKFLAQYARKYNRSIPSLSAEQKNILKSYNWPGNVRELRNVVERSVILSGPDKLQLAITSAPKTESLSTLFSDRPTLDELQRRYISQVMEETGGKLAGPSGAAMILGIKRSTLQHRMKKLGLTD